MDSNYVYVAFGVHDTSIEFKRQVTLPSWHAVLSSYELALNFIRVRQQYDRSQYCPEYLTLYCQYGIAEVRLQSNDLNMTESDFDTVERCWRYNADCQLVFNPDDDPSVIRHTEFQGRYNVGDIVYITPKGYDCESPSLSGGFGVVGLKPVSKEAWLGSGNDLATWDERYNVYFVNAFGYLDDDYVPERSLSIPREPLPSELKFLYTLAKVCAGKLELPQALMQRIKQRKVFLRNVEQFEFSKWA